MSNFKQRLFGVSVLVSLLSSCSWEEDPITPVEPETQVTKIDLIAKTVLPSEICKVTWEMSGKASTFQYRLNGGLWTDALGLTMDTLLTDGEYTFELRIKKVVPDTIVLKTIPFTVNAIPSPAAYFSPKIQKVAKVGDPVTLELYAKSTAPFSGFSADIANLTVTEVVPVAGGFNLFNTATNISGILDPKLVPTIGTIHLATVKGTVTGTPDAKLRIPVTVSKMTFTTVDKAGTASSSSASSYPAALVAVGPLTAAAKE